MCKKHQKIRSKNCLSSHIKKQTKKIVKNKNHKKNNKKQQKNAKKLNFLQFFNFSYIFSPLFFVQKNIKKFPLFAKKRCPAKSEHFSFVILSSRQNCEGAIGLFQKHNSEKIVRKCAVGKRNFFICTAFDTFRNTITSAHNNRQNRIFH